MGYGHHMKHWRNHSKDRFYQQCSGPVHGPEPPLTKEQTRALERKSFIDIVEKTRDDQFPIFVRQGSGGMWFTTCEKDCFGHRIESRDDLLEFYELYI